MIRTTSQGKPVHMNELKYLELHGDRVAPELAEVDALERPPSSSRAVSRSGDGDCTCCRSTVTSSRPGREPHRRRQLRVQGLADPVRRRRRRGHPTRAPGRRGSRRPRAAGSPGCRRRPARRPSRSDRTGRRRGPRPAAPCELGARTCSTTAAPVSAADRSARLRSATVHACTPTMSRQVATASTEAIRAVPGRRATPAQPATACRAAAFQRHGPYAGAPPAPGSGQPAARRPPPPCPAPAGPPGSGRPPRSLTSCTTPAMASTTTTPSTSPAARPARRGGTRRSSSDTGRRKTWREDSAAVTMPARDGDQDGEQHRPGEDHLGARGEHPAGRAADGQVADDRARAARPPAAAGRPRPARTAGSAAP